MEDEIIFGIRAVIEAVEAGKEIDRLLIKKDMQGDLSRELFAAIKGLDIPVQRVPLERLNRITRKNHQGVIAFTTQITYQHVESVNSWKSCFRAWMNLESGWSFKSPARK